MLCLLLLNANSIGIASKNKPAYPPIYVNSSIPFVKQFFIAKLKQDGFPVLQEKKSDKPRYELKIIYGEEWVERRTERSVESRLTIVHMAIKLRKPPSKSWKIIYRRQDILPKINMQIRRNLLQQAYESIRDSLLELAQDDWEEKLTVLIIRSKDESLINQITSIVKKNAKTCKVDPNNTP